jgi:hypothetical protein
MGKMTQVVKLLRKVFDDAKAKGVVAEYSDDLIQPGTGDIRNEIARYNETILGDDYRKSFEGGDVYHKTWSDTFDSMDGFDPAKMQANDYGYAGKGVYVTPEPLGGTAYGNITMPLKTNIQNPRVRTKANWQDPSDPYQWIPDNADKYSSMEAASAAKTKLMMNEGYDGFIDAASDAGESVIFDPKNIRSTFAAFDPAKKESSNLLAGLGGGAVLTGAALAPEQAQASATADMLARAVSDFAARRQIKDSFWKDARDVGMEVVSSVNRGFVDTLNFLSTDQVNAILEIAGSEKRIPTFLDIPGVEGATTGNYMEPGTAREMVQLGGEFLSPL